MLMILEMEFILLIVIYVFFIRVLVLFYLIKEDL